MASWFSVREALAAIRITVSWFLSTVNLFRVKVPVLSLHRTSMPAISSIAVILLVIAPSSLWEPIAIVTERTVGIAMGIPPIRRTRRLSIPGR
ncbi:unnamed protein product [Spirodela intermedia]|uniref:Uncharacterized protein n=2 Tax=Spirodela intermedia TaxID=51605 RepID=A0A7I8IMJ4_SPIIN|nr:unnamed protein product [Spirodela intermedia]CAA6659019.1 unnamed protein product [Spirodela intermedia]CAA7395306.1 unnamed protein product [Spirodela intermedia]